MMATVLDRAGGDAKVLPQVLIAEDERIIARDLAATVTELGYEVVATVATAADAIQKARNLRPNLVLMDIHLAGAVDGVQAADTIKRDRDIPIIYLTSHSDHETLRRAKLTGPLGYLTKPFRVHELRCAIEMALHKHEIDARLKARERWLATMLRAIGDGVVATDAEEKVQFVNRVAEGLTGWNQDAALGKSLDEIVRLRCERTGRSCESPVHRALNEKQTANLPEDALLVSRAGAAVPIEDSAAPILDDDGDVLGAVMVFRDITERRRTEGEVRRLNAELELRVLARTEELDAAKRELEAFSYSVAHDLRAPLRGIDGFSELLMEECSANLGTDGLAHLRRIRTATRRMGQLIDDLLGLARVARKDMQKRRVDLSRLVRTVATELREANRGRDVDLRLEEGIFVEADEQLLRIALENLLGNAWKFTSKVERAIVEFGRFDRDGAQVCFVRDNGAGFNMTYSDKLFCAFQRLHADREFEGTGIGLAIVHRIFSRHGWRIWAEAEVGHGATFYFTV